MIFILAIIILGAVICQASSVPIHLLRKRDDLSNAVAAATTLRSRYFDVSTGLWGNLWWNSGCMLATVATLAQMDGAIRGQVLTDIEQILKVASNRGDTDGTGFIDAKASQGIDGNSFINGFYDDEGWWALGWIAAYDLTGNVEYLQVAQVIFNDMTTGHRTPCGGIWWDKANSYIAAIANELFLSVAAALANRVPQYKDIYLGWAEDQWNWFSHIGLINSENLINDGLNMTTCKNNGYQTWSYNQGVILGALVELNKATLNTDYLSKASDVALAAIEKLTTADGILVDPSFSPNDETAGQFKGIFARNLALLHQAAPNSHFISFLQKNAESIWSHDRDTSTGLLGPSWQGPYTTGNPASQSSALDCLVAAAKVS
jgi:predicted alpha-1,6-mannanase (GH76 family)